MWPFGWFSDLREVATTLDRARMVSRADDDLPIDEARSSDGEVAKCASLLRQALPRASARHHRPLNRELAGLLRRLGPEDRLEADRMYRRLRAEDPSDWATHWNHALLLKHSGRFDDALAALDAYRSAGGAPDQAFNWNTASVPPARASARRLSMLGWRSTSRSPLPTTACPRVASPMSR
jgi:hypothetical protein